ncbi:MULTISPECIES: hypothetical protein [unclassified Arthrobacter]|uniref:hypothetical protein n=1 Tax=unclassified Arthrobacter TaxID=235627 RepID=UPI0033972B2F
MTPEPKDRWGRGASRLGFVAAAAVLLAGSLAACGPANSGLQHDTAQQLQQRVLGVSQAAAGNDPAGALAVLDALDADLATATADGKISEDRRRTIMTATAAVRADLTKAVAAAVAATKEAEAAAAAQQQAEADAAAAANAVPAPAVPAQGGKNAGEGKGKGTNKD